MSACLARKPEKALEIGREALSAVGPWLRTRGARFTFAGQEYRYLVHPFNTTWRNERAVELPIAQAFLRRYRGGRILEVGHVSSWYRLGGWPRWRALDHEVVDKYEVSPGVRNVDVVDLDAERRYDLILSLSTLEHVGFDEPEKDPGKPLVAVRRLISMLAPGGTLLVTVPLGYNPAIDEHLVGQPHPFDELRFLKRVSEDNRWVEATVDEVRGTAYGSPFFAANAIGVGIVRR